MGGASAASTILFAMNTFVLITNIFGRKPFDEIPFAATEGTLFIEESSTEREQTGS
jgi:hypothetical protein